MLFDWLNIYIMIIETYRDIHLNITYMQTIIGISADASKMEMRFYEC